jgi:GT2 family glycosyltransferase/ADP-heptose:LPS heptosyltransferase/predicted SAM-dependent methyltransferase
MSKLFSLIIPTVKQVDLVVSCIEKIRRHEKSDDYEIIVVDDGSDFNVQTGLRAYCQRNDVRIFCKEENKGFAHTVNVGLRNAIGEYLILVNNDIEWMKPCLHVFAEVFHRDPLIGAVGAKLMFPPGDNIQHAGVCRIGKTPNFIHINKHSTRNHPSVNVSKYYESVTGALYGVTKDVFNKIGDWNENYFLSCEDTEYSLRIWAAGYRVFYCHEIEAIHHEGLTRGNTDHLKKVKGLEWFQKERETLPKFYEDVKRFNLDAITAAVHKLNQAPMDVQPPKPAPLPPPRVLKKLEVGCGNFPQPGFIHLDVRKFDHIDVVCDFSKEPLPYPENDLDEILSNHSIEHISWRMLPHVIGEWFRTLRPGGRVFFRTPDLEFICRTYLAGKTTPEHPSDEGYITQHLSSSVTPAWWANIKLFAGQDYPSNFHFLAFDFDMAKQVLEKFGFTRVSRLNILPVFSPGELQIEAYKPGEYEMGFVVPPPTRKILLKRRAALGDVILTTPIARRLREIHGSDALIDVASDCGSIYVGNPYINNVYGNHHSTVGYDEIIDLNFAYERTPEQHIIESYTHVAFPAGVDAAYDKRTELFPTDADKDFVLSKLRESALKPENCVIMHCAVSWKNRTWPKNRWEETAAMIAKMDRRVIIIGAGADYKFQAANVFDFTAKFTIQQLSYLIGMCAVFVGNDSGLLHVAGTTKTPIVGIFTSAKGEWRVPFRNGEYGGDCAIIKPMVDCYGCLSKENRPAVFCDCRRGDYACLGQITPEMVSTAVKGFLEC